MQKEITALASSNTSVKISNPNRVCRSATPSLVSSPFKQMWVSKQEYYETGASLYVLLQFVLFVAKTSDCLCVYNCDCIDAFTGIFF